MTLVQKREKDERSVLWEVGPKEGAIEQFFDLGLAATVKTNDLHAHYILP